MAHPGEPRAGTRYELSFTTGALLIQQAAIVGPVYLKLKNWDTVRIELVRQNLLQSRTRSSAVRLAREAVKRLSVLADDEVELLTEATASERGYLLWAAACRQYQLIAEFAEEVVRERFLILAATVGHQEFDSFIHSKAVWHEEISLSKPSTLQKLRANVFRMLHEAGLLSHDGQIVPAMLSERVAERLDLQVPTDLRFFPTHQRGDRVAAE